MKDTGGKLNELRQETTARLVDDPGATRQLQRFLKEGEWETDTAAVSGRSVWTVWFLRLE